MYLIAKYEEYLENRNYEENTIQTYTMHASLFIKWFRSKHNRDIDSVIIRSTFIDFRKFLEEVLENAEGSIRTKSYSMRNFNDFLVEEGYQTNYFVNEKDFEKYRVMNTKLDVPTKEELKKLYESIAKERNTRDAALVALFQNEGLKTSVCINLKLSDYNKEAQTISYERKNQLYVRQIKNETIYNLDQYMKERYCNVPSDYIFVTNRSPKTGSSTVCKTLQKHSPSITPKSLRNLAIISDLKKGMSMDDLRNKYGALSLDYIKKCKEYIKENM